MYVMPPGALLHDVVLTWQITRRAHAGITTYEHQELSSTDRRSTFSMLLTEPSSSYMMRGPTNSTLTVLPAVKMRH